MMTFCKFESVKVILLLVSGPGDYNKLQLKKTKFRVSKPFKSKVTNLVK